MTVEERNPSDLTRSLSSCQSAGPSQTAGQKTHHMYICTVSVVLYVTDILGKEDSRKPLRQLVFAERLIVSKAKTKSVRYSEEIPPVSGMSSPVQPEVQMFVWHRD